MSDLQKQEVIQGAMTESTIAMGSTQQNTPADTAKTVQSIAATVPEITTIDTSAINSTTMPLHISSSEQQQTTVNAPVVQLQQTPVSVATSIQPAGQQQAQMSHVQQVSLCFTYLYSDPDSCMWDP